VTIVAPARVMGCVLLVVGLLLAVVIGRASKLELKPSKKDKTSFSIFLQSFSSDILQAIHVKLASFLKN